jgi:transcriptional regulator with XRE-family HTH domain
MGKSIFSEEHQVIVQRIKLARKQAGLSQQNVAKLLNKTQSYISKIEAGQIRVDVVQLKELARIYHKEINIFIE